MRLIVALACVLGCGSASTKSDCSQLQSGGSWSLTFQADTISGCMMAPSPITVKLPVPAGGACLQGCNCDASWAASSQDVDKPVVCRGTIVVSCGTAAPLNCDFSLDDNKSGSGSCSSSTCNYPLNLVKQ
jgi:hypothetical protein